MLKATRAAGFAEWDENYKDNFEGDGRLQGAKTVAGEEAARKGESISEEMVVKCCLCQLCEGETAVKYLCWQWGQRKLGPRRGSPFFTSRKKVGDLHEGSLYKPLKAGQKLSGRRGGHKNVVSAIVRQGRGG